MRDVSAETARALLSTQFPVWASLPIDQVNSAGTDHILFRLGNDKVLRFPSNADAAHNVLYHQRWMPRFARMPLRIPQILETGTPGSGYPFAWSILRWIEGEDAWVAPIHDWAKASETLGHFIRALREVDTTDGTLSGKANAYRGCSLQILDQWTRKAIAAVSDAHDEGKMLARWDHALFAAPWSDTPVWVHGDIHAANLVVRNNQLIGVIDFGLMSVGDPACDLAVAYSFIPAQYRKIFLDATGADDATKERGKGWALYFGVIALAYYRDKNPVLASIADQAIVGVLGD